jgi:hypothetical protein
MSQQTQIPELDNVGLLRFMWRQLTSMRTALILLLLTGIAAIPGSLVPQRTQNPLQVGQYFKDSPEQARWMDRFYLFDKQIVAFLSPALNHRSTPKVTNVDSMLWETHLLRH